VSNGKVKIPDVVGEDQAQATADLSSAGFQPDVRTQETDSAPPGQVLAQSPLAGTPAVKGTVVTITVAKAVPPPPPPTTTSPPPTSPGPSVSASDQPSP
jgi:serine/threonine-protein kinase